MTPSARTKHYLEEQGYFFGRTEYWNAFARKRIDLFGMFDAIAFKPTEEGAVGVQITTYSNLSSHRRKIRNNPMHRLWLEAGNRIWIICWKGKEMKLEEITNVR